MDIRDRIKNYIGPTIELMSEGLIATFSGKKKIDKIIISGVLGKEAAKKLLDVFGPTMNASKSSIFVAGDDDDLEEMFGILWRICIVEPGLELPKFDLPGDESRFLDKSAKNFLGLPEECEFGIEDSIGFDKEEVIESIEMEAGDGERILLAAADALDLIELVDRLQKDFRPKKVRPEIIPFLLSGIK